MNDAKNSPAPETILVVEDEVLVRTAISEYLRHCGYQVVEAATAGEAIVLLQEPALVINILFSDVIMTGGMDGFGLARWVRAHRPDVEVLLAGNIEKAAETAGELCEEGPHLQKPYEPQAIVDWIKKLRASKK